MDPVTAFSLACGVVQLVDICIRVAAAAQEFSKKGSLGEHEDLEKQVKQLSGIQAKLKPTSQLSHHSSKAARKEDRELALIASKSDEAAQELLRELNDLKLQGSRDSWKALKQAIKSMRRASTIERLQAKFDGYRKTLETRILVSVKQDLSTVALEQNEKFQKLDKSLQITIQSFVEVSTSFENLAKLVNDEGTLTRKVVSDEAGLTRRTIEEEFAKSDSKQEQDKLRQKVLQSLWFPNMHSRAEQIKDAHKETFEWIFDQSGKKVRPWSNFVEWLEVGSGSYWINGKAGSGKSTLMSFVWQDPRTIESLGKWAGQKELLIPAFFFWAAGDDLERSIEGFLRSIAYQMLDSRPNLVSVVDWQRQRNFTPSEEIGAWTKRRLLGCVKTLVRELAFSCRLCFFIDGLDEFGGEGYELLELIDELISNSEVKACFSSRPEKPFQAHECSCMLKLQDLTKEDIQTYVKSKLGNFPQIRRLPVEKFATAKSIEDLIVDKANGVFLWVQLVVQSQIIGIRNSDSVETLLERIDSLPTEVEGLYSRMLSRIDVFYRKEAAWYLEIAMRLGPLEGNPAPLFSVFNTTIVKFGLTEDFHLSDTLTPDYILSKCSEVSNRLLLTCAGFLEIIQYDDVSSEDNSERGLWLLEPGLPYPEGSSSDPESSDVKRAEQSTNPSLKSLEIDGDDLKVTFDTPEKEGPYLGWTHKLIRFCHRSAMEFFSDDEEGGHFLKSSCSILIHDWLLGAAIYVSRYKLAVIGGKHHESAFYLRLAFKCCRRIFDLEQLRSAIPKIDLVSSSITLLEHFDSEINGIWQQQNQADRQSHWCSQRRSDIRIIQQLRADPRSDKQGFLWTNHHLPSDLMSLAAFLDIRWYTEYRRSTADVAAIDQLGFCCLFKLEDFKDFYERSEVPGKWNVSTSTDLDLLCHLVRLGLDPNSGPRISYWESVLTYLYNAIKYEYVSEHKLTRIADTFLNAGADPDQVILHKRALRSRKGASKLVYYEIQFSMPRWKQLRRRRQMQINHSVPGIGANVKVHLRKTPRIWFHCDEAEDNGHQWWPENGHYMSDSEFEMLDEVDCCFFFSSSDENAQIQRSLQKIYEHCFDLYPNAPYDKDTWKEDSEG